MMKDEAREVMTRLYYYFDEASRDLCISPAESELLAVAHKLLGVVDEMLLDTWEVK